MSVLNTISTTVVTAYFLKKLFEKTSSTSTANDQVDTTTLDRVPESELLEWLKMNFEGVKKQFEESIGQHLTQEDFVAYLEKLGIDARKLFDQ